MKEVVMYSLKKALIHGLCLTALLCMPVGLFSHETSVPVTKAGFSFYVGPSWGGNWGYRQYYYPRYYYSPYYYYTPYYSPYYYYGPSYYYRW
jgi:hypothetical protein